MISIENKQLAHQLIDEADEKLVNLIIALANEYNDEFELSPEEEKEMKEEEETLISGEIKGLTEAEFWASFKKTEEDV